MIRKLEVKNFTVFPKATLEFGARLNVIVGENGAGKTHLRARTVRSVSGQRGGAGTQVIAIREGGLEHRFDEGWTASKFDEWPFYVKHFQSQCAENKAVDIVALAPSDKELWLVELKDYRVYPRTKSIDLAEEVAVKVRDSLAGIVAASKWHSHHEHLAEARRDLSATRLRVAVHVEQPAQHSKLFPRKYDIANLQQKLRQLVRAVDPHPVVMDLTTPGVPWVISAVP